MKKDVPEVGKLIGVAFFVICGVLMISVGLISLFESKPEDLIYCLGIIGFGIFCLAYFPLIAYNKKFFKWSEELGKKIEALFRSLLYIAGVIVGIIVIILLVWLAWDKWVVSGYEKYIKKYDKPWFEGSEYAVVCKLPDYDNSQCYTLVVDSEEGFITQINFPNGGYRAVSDSECYKAAEGLYNFDRFCRAWDTKGDSWDIMPAGSNPAEIIK